MRASRFRRLYAVVLLIGGTQLRAQDVRYFEHPNPRAPFSQAVRAGDTIYISGQIGVAPDGVVPKDLAVATRYAMDNVKRALSVAGAGMDNVTHCTVMLTDMSQWDDFNRAYLTYFRPGHLPARSAIGVSSLALGASLEIECSAYKPTRGG